MSKQELLSIESVLRQVSHSLSEVSATPHLDAEILLMEVLKVPRSYLYAHAKKDLTASQQEMFFAFVARRMQGEPIAYIIGYREFWSLNLKVNQHTLIPRPETELLVELVLKHLPDMSMNYRVVDLGTGSGAIALALASERKHWMIDAVDISEQAIALAQENAQRLDLTHINFLVGSWCQPLKKRSYHAIISNPPYIAQEDPCWLRPEMHYEPKTALIAEQAGLADLQHLILEAKNYLMEEGYLLLEHGWQQAEHLQQLLRKEGYNAIQTFADLAGHARVTVGRF